MLQGGRDFDLREESLGAERRADVVPEHFDGDFAVVPDVARAVDRGHAAAADLVLDQVAPSQRGIQLPCGADVGLGIRHASLYSSAWQRDASATQPVHNGDDVGAEGGQRRSRRGRSLCLKREIHDVASR